MQPCPPMTVGSLFAGIGGFDLGLERAGMQVLWQVEIDNYCRKVLAKHWPDVKRYGDVRDCGTHNLERVDLVCGGFPCQPVSHAGQRKGDADERWLWPEFARVVRELKPRWVLAENVPGLLSIDAGRLFGTVLGDLASLGYAVEWECIPAAALGTPHIRDRLWILAYANGIRFCQQGDEHHKSRRTEIVRAGQALSRRNSGDRTGTKATSGDVADTQQHRLQGGEPTEGAEAGLRRRLAEPGGTGDWWAVEPDVGRVVDGFPARVDRLRALGNAVVPQVVEWIGRRIVEADNGAHMFAR